MSTYSPEPVDDDRDGPIEDPSQSLAARAAVAHTEAERAIHFLRQRHGMQALAALINILDEEYAVYSDVYLERRQVDEYAFTEHGIYVDELWDAVRNSPHFALMVDAVRDLAAAMVPAMVEDALRNECRRT